METIYQTKNIKPDYQSIEEKIENKKIISRRELTLIKWFLKHFDENIKVTYNFDDIGITCIRLFIYVKKSKEAALKLIKWLKTLKKWHIEKFWREEKGSFSYRIEKTYGSSKASSLGVNYIIFIENIYDIDQCKITKKIVTKEIFVTDCEKEIIIMK